MSYGKNLGTDTLAMEPETPEAVLRKLIARLCAVADFHFARKYVDCIVEEYAAKLAALGCGTCHDVAGMDDVFECSACGGRYQAWAIKRWARYCPDCGRKVVTA